VDKRKYADRREYNVIAVSKRRKKLRQMAVDLLGGKCIMCGYCRDIKALDFHHKDKTTKEFGLSDRGMTRSWEKIKLEVEKCVLVCANCHREIHSGSIKLAHNTLSLVK
jgi:ferredoxin